jgi:polar amino acid transport system substrate-binding protein
MRHILLCLALSLFAFSARAETLIFSAESYPPYNFKNTAGEITGVFIDQLKIMLDKAGIDSTVTMMPWARAIALAETQPMHCAYGAARTAERETRFKWVEPMSVDRNILVTTKQSGIQPSGLDQIKNYIVGTQRNDYTQTVLQNIGFTKIDLSADFNISLNKLLAGRIQLMPMSDSTFSKLYSSETELIEVALLTEQRLGIACNKSVPDTLITSLQQNLDVLIADGTQKRIFEKYGLIVRD